jgi:hypothetical protein
MNERIKELAKQADFFLESDKEIRKLKNFAESIVLECIDIADEYDGAGSTIVGRIKKHFGVE